MLLLGAGEEKERKVEMMIGNGIGCLCLGGRCLRVEMGCCLVVLRTEEGDLEDPGGGGCCGSS